MLEAQSYSPCVRFQFLLSGVEGSLNRSHFFFLCELASVHVAEIIHRCSLVVRAIL